MHHFCVTVFWVWPVPYMMVTEVTSFLWRFFHCWWWTPQCGMTCPTPPRVQTLTDQADLHDPTFSVSMGDLLQDRLHCLPLRHPSALTLFPYIYVYEVVACIFIISFIWCFVNTLLLCSCWTNMTLLKSPVHVKQTKPICPHPHQCTGLCSWRRAADIWCSEWLPDAWSTVYEIYQKDLKMTITSLWVSFNFWPRFLTVSAVWFCFQKRCLDVKRKKKKFWIY